jgi:hypothetical protein
MITQGFARAKFDVVRQTADDTVTAARGRSNPNGVNHEIVGTSCDCPGNQLGTKGLNGKVPNCFQRCGVLEFPLKKNLSGRQHLCESQCRKRRRYDTSRDVKTGRFDNVKTGRFDNVNNLTSGKIHLFFRA